MSIIEENLLKPHWILDLPESDYHSDEHFVSSTGLKKMLKSPKSFFAHHFAQGLCPPLPTRAQVMGRLIHKAILEPKSFGDSFRVEPEFRAKTLSGKLSHRSKLAFEARTAWVNSLSPGVDVISKPDFEMLEKIVESFMRHPFAKDLVSDGTSEMSGYFSCPDSKVRCRIRPDFLSSDGQKLIDIKSTINCSYDSFSNCIWKYRYDFQLAMYVWGIEIITGKKPEFPILLAIEKTPPFEIAVYVADDNTMEKGRQDLIFAIERLKNCAQQNKWEGCQTEIQEIGLPSWAYKKGL